jgi:hypothetical protein
VHIAIFELLPNGAGGLRGARCLDSDDFDKIGDAADVFLFVGLGGERLDGDRDGRIRLLLRWALVEDLRECAKLGVELQ